MRRPKHIVPAVALTIAGMLLGLATNRAAWSQPKPAIPQGGETGALGGFLTPSDHPSQVDPQIAVSSTGRVYRMWIDSTKGRSGEIRLQTSLDGGTTWSGEPVVVDKAKPQGTEAAGASLKTDGTGRVMVLWRLKARGVGGRKDMQFTMSPDGGATWPTAPKVLNRDGQALSGEMAADGQGHVYAAWYDERKASKTPKGVGSRVFHIFFNRSDDFGQTWLTDDVLLSGPERTGKAPFISALPRIQADGKGGVFVAWIDTRTGRTEIIVRASQDHGKTWGPEVNVSQGALSSTSHQLLVDDAGRLLLVWADNRLGPSDVFFSRSEDRGKNWSEPARLSRHRPGVALSAAPHMAVSRDGRVYVAWQDTRNGREDIYMNISADGGRTWLESDVRLDRDGAGTGVSDLPHVLVRPDGAVVVAWSDDRSGFEEILLTRSTDGGKTWLDREIRVDVDGKPGDRGRSVKLAANAAGVIFATWEIWEGAGLQITKRVGYRRLVLPEVSSAVAPAR